MYNFRTDLANERRDLYIKANNIGKEIPGIETEERKVGDNIFVSKVKVLDKQGEEAIGKPCGNYITIDIKNLKLASEEDIEKAACVVNDELVKIIDSIIGKKEDILVVGLGNNNVTPDSLRTRSNTRYRYYKAFIKLCTTIFRTKY